MRLPLALTMIALALRGAYGQPLPAICGPTADQQCVPGSGSHQHAATGNPALDRAMTICDAHWHKPVVTDGPGAYEPPYAAACGVVEHQWDESTTAKAQREAAKKTEDDLVWLRAWVQTLRAGKP